MCLVYENVQTRRMYVRMYTTTSGLGSEGIERFFVTAIPPQQRTYVRHDEFAHKVRNIHKDFFVDSQWYQRALETFAGVGLPVGRLARSFYTVTSYDVCMYVVAVDNESKLFLLHDDFDCMMNQVLLLLQLHVAKLPRIFFFSF